MKKRRILFVTTEITPFLQISNVADVVKELPKRLQEKGHEIRIMMPKFGIISDRRHRLHEVVRLSGINIPVGDDHRPLIIKVASIPDAKLQVYFLDNEDYFGRKAHFINPKTNKPYTDNDERAIFFCRGVLETVKKLGWPPDIIHCHDWMTSLIPLFIQTYYKNDPTFRRSKIVYNVSNQSWNMTFSKTFVEKNRLPEMDKEILRLYEDGTSAGIMKGGMKLADAVSYYNGTELDRGLSNFITKISEQKTVLHQTEGDNLLEDYSRLYDKITN